MGELEQEKILVTGGSGLVGQTLRDQLPHAIYISSSDYDLRDEAAVIKMFERYSPTSVVHLAGRVAGIYDHMRYPVQYFEDNLLMNTFVLRQAYRHQVTKFIGMLSTCIYPDVVETYPLVESDLHKGPPTQTVFSYAYTKRSLAVQIENYNKQYGVNYNYLVPCNLYGEYDKFDAAHSHYVSDLMRKIAEAKDHITLFGSGNPIRQFMHASDLIKVIQHYLVNDIKENVNVATLEVKTIREIAEIAITACGKDYLSIQFDATKVDGQYRKDVSTEKLLKIMPDFICTSLHDGIQKTFNSIQNPKKLVRGWRATA